MGEAEGGILALGRCPSGIRGHCKICLSVPPYAEVRCQEFPPRFKNGEQAPKTTFRCGGAGFWVGGEGGLWPKNAREMAESLAFYGLS